MPRRPSRPVRPGPRASPCERSPGAPTARVSRSGAPPGPRHRCSSSTASPSPRCAASWAGCPRGGGRSPTCRGRHDGRSLAAGLWRVRGLGGYQIPGDASAARLAARSPWPALAARRGRFAEDRRQRVPRPRPQPGRPAPVRRPRRAGLQTSGRAPRTGSPSVRIGTALGGVAVSPGRSGGRGRARTRVRPVGPLGVVRRRDRAMPAPGERVHRVSRHMFADDFELQRARRPPADHRLGRRGPTCPDLGRRLRPARLLGADRRGLAPGSGPHARRPHRDLGRLGRLRADLGPVRQPRLPPDGWRLHGPHAGCLHGHPVARRGASSPSRSAPTSPAEDDEDVVLLDVARRRTHLLRHVNPGYWIGNGGWDGPHYLHATEGVFHVLDARDGTQLLPSAHPLGDKVVDAVYTPDRQQVVAAERLRQVDLARLGHLPADRAHRRPRRPPLLLAAGPHDSAFVVYGGSSTSTYWNVPADKWAVVDLRSGAILMRGAVDLEQPIWAAMLDRRSPRRPHGSDRPGGDPRPRVRTAGSARRPGAPVGRRTGLRSRRTDPSWSATDRTDRCCCGTSTPPR